MSLSPRLVFRVGFAGSSRLTADGEQHLPEIYELIARRLAEIAPGTPIPSGAPSRVASYFSHEDPLLRLVSGLCEGADAIAMELLPGLKVCPPGAKPDAPSCVATELAAVIPFEVSAYRAQTTFLLRQVDLLVAAADPGEVGKPGGNPGNRPLRPGF